jgi:hypothetical protein
MEKCGASHSKRVHYRNPTGISIRVYVTGRPLSNSNDGRFEVFTAVTIKNGVFWVVTPCGSCKNRRFGGTWSPLHQGDNNR